MSIFVTDVGLAGMLYLLYTFGQAYGWKALAAYYFVPYVVSDICPPGSRPQRVLTRLRSPPQLCNHWYAAPCPRALCRILFNVH